MIILIVAFAGFSVAMILLINGAVANLPTEETAAERGAATLAEDHLVTSPGSSTLDRQCTADFFAERTIRCGFPNSWDTGNYLSLATGIRGKALNATVYDTNGDIMTANAVRLALGPKIPSDEESNQWTRRRSGDLDRDGNKEWVTIRFTVW
jgi:hypothetical protein